MKNTFCLCIGLYTKIQKYGVTTIKKNEMNTFIQQWCIKLIKSDNSDINNVTK